MAARDSIEATVGAALAAAVARLRAAANAVE